MYNLCAVSLTVPNYPSSCLSPAKLFKSENSCIKVLIARGRLSMASPLGSAQAKQTHRKRQFILSRADAFIKNESFQVDGNREILMKILVFSESIKDGGEG